MKCAVIDDDGVVTAIQIWEVCPDNLIEADGVNIGDSYDSDTGVFTSNRPVSEDADETDKTEYNWASGELSDADVQIAYHNESSSRAVATLYEWYAYKEALRDYATVSTDDDGESTYSVNDVSGESYTYDETDYAVTVDDDGRPVAPSDDDETTD
jgi:hypothetical protein